MACCTVKLQKVSIASSLEIWLIRLYSPLQWKVRTSTLGQMSHPKSENLRRMRWYKKLSLVLLKLDLVKFNFMALSIVLTGEVHPQPGPNTNLVLALNIKEKHRKRALFLCWRRGEWYLRHPTEHSSRRTKCDRQSYWCAHSLLQTEEKHSLQRVIVPPSTKRKRKYHGILHPTKPPRANMNLPLTISR